MSVAATNLMAPIAPIAPVARTTFHDVGTEKLRSLGYAGETFDETEALVPLFRELVGPWGNVAMGSRPTYPSHISDDQAPFEFALAISAGPPEIQFYVEAQGSPPDLISNMIAGRSQLDTIAGEFGLPLERLRRVQHLFFPENPLRRGQERPAKHPRRFGDGLRCRNKFSPLIVEKEFELAGFRTISKQLIGPVEDPERQSLFVYEYALT